MAILAGVCVAGIALFMVPLFVGDKGAYDPATLCPTDRSYGRTIVIVDKTDPFTDSQSAFLRTEIERIRDDMDEYEKLTIYVLNQSNFSTPKPVFELCKPGTGEDANALYQNPQKIRQRFENRFGRPLEELLADLTKGDVADRSPIMEMIRNVSYRGDFDMGESNEEKGKSEDRGVKRQLVIISDMLQHMPEFSQYQAPVTFEAFAKTEYFRHIRATLPGVVVHLIYLLRHGREKIQTASHLIFWEKFFRNAGAELVDVRYGP